MNRQLKVFLTLWILTFAVIQGGSALDPYEQAKNHPIEYSRPAVDFFEGALLGNGGMGVVVNTRPDAILFRFGHNNVWDIRLDERHKDEVGTFQELYEQILSMPESLESVDEDPWYSDYRYRTRASYRNKYPRPFPCGTVLFAFDRRVVELLGHRTSIDDGLCTVDLLIYGKRHRLESFVDMDFDRVWIRLVDEDGDPAPSCFTRVAILPDPETPKEQFPEPLICQTTANEGLAFRQVLPLQIPEEYEFGVRHPKDRAFRTGVRVSTPFGESLDDMSRSLKESPEFFACLSLEEGLATKVPADSFDIPQPSMIAFKKARSRSVENWKVYWRRSGVALEDEYLEKIWYWNHYFYHCSVKPGVNCPGLFANWMYGDVGTAWHGDYHLDYNVQQPFWLAFSSNRVEKHLAYVETLEKYLLPVSQAWARDYYGMRGTMYPVTLYPLDMNTSPYPVPPWGMMICCTPWAVQSMWWHYDYTRDETFLRDRAFPAIREAVLFLVDYMARSEARGERFGDNKYHIFPSLVPEVYGFTPGFRKYNTDSQADLALTKFAFRRYLEAIDILDLQESQESLVAEVQNVLDHFPEYPTADSEREGEVFVAVAGENPEEVHNVPASLFNVFPCEEIGLGSDPEIYELAAATYRNAQVEGGNEIVFINLIGARLGLLDLDRFKRQIEYAMLSNGACYNAVLQAGGRYDDATDFDYMKRMGIWFENLTLPVVVNECLMQSYDGTIRLFPNWPSDKDAGFQTFRASGAFLVSAVQSGGKVRQIEILSEKGTPLRLISPWPEDAWFELSGEKKKVTDEIIEVDTKPGQVLTFQPLPPSQ